MKLLILKADDSKEKEKISEEIRRISGDEVIINFTGDEYEQ